MARPNKIASRYAKAIFDSLKEPQKIVAMIGELQKFTTLVEKNEELRNVMTSAIFTATQRRAVVEDLAGKLGLSTLALRILKVISDAKRMERLPSIIARLQLNVLEVARRVPMQVASAVNLGNDERKTLEQRFKQVLGKEVEASYTVDESLIAGLKVIAGSRTFDGSVSGWLASFEEQLVGGTI